MARQDTLLIANNKNAIDSLKYFLVLSPFEVKIETRRRGESTEFHIADCKDLFRAGASKNHLDRLDDYLHSNVVIDLNVDNPNCVEARELIIIIICKITHHLDWKFCLYHDDFVAMIYKDNQLTLNKLADFWKKEKHLKLLSLPYTFDEFPP